MSGQNSEAPMSSHQSRPQDELHADLMTPFDAAVKGISKATDPFGVMASQFNATAVWLKHPQELLQTASSQVCPVMSAGSPFSGNATGSTC
jgi:hypothetical protein